MGPQAIVDAVVKLASNRDKVMKQSLACRKLVESEYSWDKTAMRVIEAIVEVAQN